MLFISKNHVKSNVRRMLLEKLVTLIFFTKFHRNKNYTIFQAGISRIRKILINTSDFSQCIMIKNKSKEGLSSGVTEHLILLQLGRIKGGEKPSGVGKISF